MGIFCAPSPGWAPYTCFVIILTAATLNELLSHTAEDQLRLKKDNKPTSSDQENARVNSMLSLLCSDFSYGCKIFMLAAKLEKSIHF